MKFSFPFALLLIMLATINSAGQNLGVGLAYAFSNSMNFEVIYVEKGNNFKLGFTYQFSNAKGEMVTDQLPNYGKTVDGSGSYFLSIDLGYGKRLKEKFQLDGELSIGSMSHFTNFIDNRFNGGGYHMITKKETVVGLGLNGGYFLTENLVGFVGFNTLRKLQFGLRWFI